MGRATRQSGVNGVGWVDTYTPQLIEADGSTTDTLVVINNGTSASYFDLVDGVYQARFDSPSQLSYDSGTDTYTLVDGDGNQIVFTGFSTDRPAAQQGEFASYTDAATGQSIAVTSYTDNGNIAEVQGTTTSGGNTYTAIVPVQLPGLDGSQRGTAEQRDAAHAGQRRGVEHRAAGGSTPTTTARRTAAISAI